MEGIILVLVIFVVLLVCYLWSFYSDRRFLESEEARKKWGERRDREEAKKAEKFTNSIVKGDEYPELELLRKEMEILGLSYPEGDKTKIDYWKSCLSLVREHYKKLFNEREEKFREKIKSEWLYISCSQCKIYKTHSSFLIYPNYEHDERFLKTLSFELKNKKLKLEYNYASISYCNISMEEALKKLKELASINVFENKIITISSTDMFWRIEGDVSSSYKIGNAAANVVLGGMVFGVAGVVGGAAKSNKENNQDNRYITINDRVTRKGCVIASMQVSSFGFNSALEDLNNKLPEYQASTLCDK